MKLSPNEIKVKAMTIVSAEGKEQKIFVPVQESPLPASMRTISKWQIHLDTKIPYNRVLKLCREQKIRTTVDGRVTEQALADYLNNNQ